MDARLERACIPMIFIFVVAICENQTNKQNTNNQNHLSMAKMHSFASQALKMHLRKTKKKVKNHTNTCEQKLRTKLQCAIA